MQFVFRTFYVHFVDSQQQFMFYQEEGKILLLIELLVDCFLSILVTFIIFWRRLQVVSLFLVKHRGGSIGS